MSYMALPLSQGPSCTCLLWSCSRQINYHGGSCSSTRSQQKTFTSLEGRPWISPFSKSSSSCCNLDELGNFVQSKTVKYVECSYVLGLKCLECRAIHAQELDLAMATRLRNLFEQELASTKNLWFLGSTARPLLCLFISWFPACLFSGCSLRSKVGWHQEGLAWERVWGCFCRNTSSIGTLNQSWSIN